VHHLCLVLVIAIVGCAARTHEEYLASEAAFLRLGVDRKAEESEVRRVLAQRKLDVVAELSGPHFSALGAESRDGKVTAVRVISDRGVVLAEDAVFDDLFSPARVTLLEGFAPRLDDLELVGFSRARGGADAGCVSLLRVLPDGQLSEVVLDVSVFGPRACVVQVAHAGRGRLFAEVGFPGLSAGVTPHLLLELGFKPIQLGKPDPIVRVAKAVENSERLQAERSRLNAASCAVPMFAERHALGVARAALSLFVGESKDRQVAAYRECAGSTQPGSVEADTVADVVGYIERGFADGMAEAPLPALDPGSVVVEPDAP